MLRASRVGEYGGVRIRIPRPEDLIVFKLVACRPRDLDDAEEIYTREGIAETSALPVPLDGLFDSPR